MNNNEDTIAIKIKVNAADGTVEIKNLQTHIKSATDSIKANFDNASNSIYSMGKEFLKSAGIFASATILIGSLGAGVRAVSAATVDFNSKWTQVRTIVDESKVDMKGLEKGALAMAGELGSAGDMARGTYMMISSMQRPKTALDDLTAAAKFARGGQADLNDSVMAGTGIMNAFGDKAGNLTHVYDVLWQTISDGVTTAAQLAPAIGRVTPMAEAAGLSIEEMAGSIAVMTQISQNTNETITALRGILTSVLKPSKETADEAERLGINFSATAIKTMGFSGWLADMNAKVIAGKGDMAKLFPSVEALGGILQLTRNDLSNFNTEMDNMSRVSGNNQRAFEKYKESFEGAWSSIKNEVETTMIQAILPAMKDLAKWLNENGRELTASVKGLVSGISSTISFITKFHDVIILAGEAWLVYFAATKVTAWSSAFSTAMKASSGLLSIFFSELKVMPSYYSLLRSEGLSTGKALSGTMSTFNYTMKSVGISVGDLAAKLHSLPTAVKLGIAFVIADVGLGGLDKFIGYIEEKTGCKYQSNFEFLGKFKYVIDVFSGQGFAENLFKGTIDNNIKETMNNIQTKFKLSLDQIKTVADTFHIKLNPVDTDQFEIDFRGAMGTIDQLKAKFLGLYQEGKSYLGNLADEVLPHFGTKVKEISATTVAAVSAENKAYLALKATVANYTSEELESLLDGYKKSKTLTDIQIKSIQDAKKEYEDIARSVGVLSKEGYQKLGSEVARFSGIFRSNYDQFKDNNKGVLEATKLVQGWMEKYKNAGRDIPVDLKSISAELENLKLLTTEITDQELDFGMADVLYAGEKAAASLFGTIEGGIFVFESFEEQQKAVIRTIAILTNNTALYTAVTSNMTKAISGANLKSWADNWATATQKVELAMNVFNGMVGILEKLGLKMDSTTQGLIELGNAAGQIATGIISKDPVAIIGGVVNAIGSIIDIFKKERDWAGEANELMGNLPGVTEAITKKVAELGKELGSVKMAYRQLMGEIIQDTVKSKKSFEEWSKQVLTLFNYIGRYETTIDGKVISYEGVENLNSAFQALVDKADEFKMHGTAAMVDIIRKAEELGKEVESINAYIKNQLTGNGGLIDSFNLFVNSMTDNDAWLGVISENSQFLDTQVQSMVAALTKQGYSYSEIVMMLGDSLTTLEEKAASEGVQLPEYIRKMTDMAAFIEQNKTLITNIDATRGMMEALGNTNNMTKDSFASFQTQGIANFNALRAAGASEIDALRLMAPYLSDLQKYAETYKLTLDDQTQALIDQANANNLLTGSNLTDTQKQITLLEEIVTLLGGKIPYAVQTVADSVATSMGSITGDVETWNQTLTDAGETIVDLGGKITDLDGINHEKIIGNTIVADTQQWIGKLIEVNDNIYKIIDTVTVADTKYKKVMMSVSTETSQNWLAGLKDVRGQFTGIITEILPKLSETDQKTLTDMTQHLTGYNNELVALWNQMQTASSEDLPGLQAKFNSVWANMGTETQQIIDLVSKYKDVLGIEIPDTLTTLAEKYAFIMNAMSGSTDQLYVGTDGVLRTLREIIALQGQVTAGQIGSNYGVYTQEQKINNSLKFHQLAELWSSNRSKILSDKSWMGSFYRDLYALRGGVLDEESGQFNTFLASITQWNTHIQAGHTWDEANKKWIIPQAAKGGLFIVEQGYPDNRPGKNIGVHTGELVRVYTAAETTKYMSQGYVPAFDPRSGIEMNTPATIFDYFQPETNMSPWAPYMPEMPDTQDTQDTPARSMMPVIIPAPAQSSSGFPGEIVIRHEVTIKIEGDAGGRIEIDEKALAREILELVENNDHGFTSKLVKELGRYS